LNKSEYSPDPIPLDIPEVYDSLILKNNASLLESERRVFFMSTPFYDSSYFLTINYSMKISIVESKYYF